MEWCSDIQVNLGRTDLFTVFCPPGCECVVCPVPATSPLECPVFTGDIAGALKTFRVSAGLWVEWSAPLKHFLKNEMRFSLLLLGTSVPGTFKPLLWPLVFSEGFQCGCFFKYQTGPHKSRATPECWSVCTKVLQKNKTKTSLVFC